MDPHLFFCNQLYTTSTKLYKNSRNKKQWQNFFYILFLITLKKIAYMAFYYQLFGHKNVTTSSLHVWTSLNAHALRKIWPWKYTSVYLEVAVYLQKSIEKWNFVFLHEKHIKFQTEISWKKVTKNRIVFFPYFNSANQNCPDQKEIFSVWNALNNGHNLFVVFWFVYCNEFNKWNN